MFTKFSLSSFLFAFVLILSPWEVGAFDNMTYQDALKLQFKDCKLSKENVFLTKKQQTLIKEKNGHKTSPLILRYKTCRGSYVYIDSHIVRTLNETTVIEVANNALSFFKIASFMEPKEYLPPKAWLELFKTKQGSEVDALTGATLSENAIRRVIKKYIIVDKVLSDKA